MCSKCIPLGFDFHNKHSEINCPYLRACYCSYCGINGHTTGNCDDRFCRDEPSSPVPQIYEYSDFVKQPALEVVDDESNIRAFLIAFGIPLSGKPETNRENLILAAIHHNPPLELYWIHPLTTEYRLQVDVPEIQKTKKKKAK